MQDQFRREGFSETASEIAMTDFERIYQYALDNVHFVRRAEVLAEFVFNACIPFGITVLEKEVVKMSPIEWILVMLIFISSGVTVLTMIVNQKGVIKK